MTSYNQGDVVLVPFPFTDFSTFKQRPAVVISSNGFNRIHQDVIVAAITSHLSTQPLFSDYRLDPADWKSAGLPKASLVKLGKVVTIDQRLIRKKLGSLSLITLPRIITQFQQIIACQ